MSKKGPNAADANAERTPYEKEKEWLKVLASLYLDTNRFDEAIVLLEALFLMFPQEIDTLRMMSKAYLYANRYDEAIEATRRYLSTDEAKESPSKQAVALYLQGQAYWRAGKRQEAKLAFDKFNKLKDITEL